MFFVKLAMIALSTLGIVFVSGRMLGVLKTDKTKNGLAVVVLFLASALVVIRMNHVNELLTEMTQYELVGILLETLFYFAISAVVYVLFVWRLWWRLDTLLDKKIGKDDSFKETKANPKRKTTKK